MSLVEESKIELLLLIGQSIGEDGRVRMGSRAGGWVDECSGCLNEGAVEETKQMIHIRMSGQEAGITVLPARAEHGGNQCSWQLSSVPCYCNGFVDSFQKDVDFIYFLGV